MLDKFIDLRLPSGTECITDSTVHFQILIRCVFHIEVILVGWISL